MLVPFLGVSLIFSAPNLLHILILLLFCTHPGLMSDTQKHLAGGFLVVVQALISNKMALSCVLNPKPYTLNPRRYTLNLKHKTLHSKPSTHIWQGASSIKTLVNPGSKREREP